MAGCRQRLNAINAVYRLCRPSFLKTFFLSVSSFMKLCQRFIDYREHGLFIIREFAVDGDIVERWSLK